MHILNYCFSKDFKSSVAVGKIIRMLTFHNYSLRLLPNFCPYNLFNHVKLVMKSIFRSEKQFGKFFLLVHHLFKLLSEDLVGQRHSSVLKYLNELMSSRENLPEFFVC